MTFNSCSTCQTDTCISNLGTDLHKVSSLTAHVAMKFAQ